jgi:outer membrane lipoprotein SlyB
MLSTQSTLIVALAAAASLSLSACVAPGYPQGYTPYGAQQGYQGQTSAYGQPAQPAYAQPGTVQQPAYAAPAPQQPYDTQDNGQYGGQYDSQYGNQYGNQPANQYGSQYGNQPANQYGGQYGAQYGTISNISPISGATGASGIAGTVVGALVGGVVGNQFGGGHGRDAATVIGALGGAYAGNQIGQRMGQPAGYRIDVQLSDGSMRAFNVPTPGDLRPGDRVQVNGNQLSRY